MSSISLPLTTGTWRSDPGPIVVEAPFNELGDCILQCPDGTRFKVFRNILSLSSPFFYDLFNLPQEPNQNKSSTSSVDDGGMLVIDVSEDPRTLYTLLRLLYPTDVPIIDCYGLATSLIEACDKYFIRLDRLRASPSLRNLMIKPALLKEHGLRAYALAWRLGLEDEAKTASRYLHSVDIKDRQIIADLNGRAGTMGALLALWDLRLRREEALDVVVDSIPLRQWVCLPHGGLDDDNKMSYENEGNFRARARLLRHVTHLALQEPYPQCKDIRSFIGLQRVICGYCPGVPQAEVAPASAALANVIERYPQTISGLHIS
ncbi:hypothetical protein FRB94_010131 [Tulasnella sp. JGI-2019a]|nr:hypothetical protein FRB94_010131 [Tulasnella sp. JGI-2019a]KAG9018380.1 hypothetical protein FRB93_000083 [Tulasnella sp. JGI-2019a]KAG9037567.1 hypothetical protein FRB95_005149 [Tulasnella sp. JGI-2019a]